ncbi:hypothetical protein ACOSP7_014351 [Xanthoceras sorbifolium]
MGRPPCCDKVGIKKGPWTPEEDIILVSYIQEHGPGNWRSVPTNTGLLRCSKSCRLRWTNYLRPGIKRGNFTPHEEGMIIHLQALLGNKWAAIASYLPQRTDNDIKNYWNTHLKKKLKKFQSALDPHVTPDTSTTSHDQFVSKSFSDRKSLDFTNQASNLRLNQAAAASSYASSTENISRLLEGWMRSSPKSSNTNNSEHHDLLKGGSQDEKSSVVPQQYNNNNNDSVDNSVATTSLHCYRPKEEQEGGDLITNEEFISILSFENLNNVSWDKSTSDNSTTKGSQNSANEQNINATTMADQKKQRSDQSTTPPLSILEKWLLDESSAGQVEEINQMMELSPIF